MAGDLWEAGRQAHFESWNNSKSTMVMFTESLHCIWSNPGKKKTENWSPKYKRWSHLSRVMAHGELSTMTELFAFPLWFPLLCMQTRMGHGNSNHQTNKQTKVEDNQKEINFLLLFLFLNELKETIIYLLNWPPLRKTQEKRKKKTHDFQHYEIFPQYLLTLHCRPN